MHRHRFSGWPIPLALLALSLAAPASAARWEPLPLWGGEVQVASAPDSSVVYAATPAAGLYQSADGGATWQLMSHGPDGLQVDLLGVDPHDPRRLYAAAVAPADYLGLFRSEDGGRSWQESDAGIPDLVFAVAFDPETPGRLYAGTTTGLYRSEDGGRTWTRIAFAGERAIRVAVSPDDPQVMLVALDRGVQRSSDGGAAFVEVLDGLLEQIVFAPSTPGRVYGIDGTAVVRRSDDLGATWTSLPPAPSFPRALAVTRTGALLAGLTKGVARSTDGGATWQSPPGPPDTPRSFAVLDGGVLAGGFRGVWRSLTDGQGWRESSTGLRAHAILSLDVAADAASTLWLSTAGGLFTSRNEGASFQSRPPLSGLFNYLFLLTVHPRQPQVAYAYGCCVATAPYVSLLKTEDGGRSWKRLPYPGVLNHLTVITVDPSNPAVVYAGGTRDGSLCSALRSTDGGATWSCISPVRPSDLFSLVIDPQDPKVLYGLFDGRLYRSANRGTAWKRVPAAGSGRLFGFLALDPNRRGRLYGFSEGTPGVFRSEDGGKTWGAATNGLPAAGYPSDLLVDPSRPGRVWVALRLFSQTGEEVASRIFRSDDAGRHWTEASTGLEPGVIVTELEADPRDADVLYAGTAGRGLYRLRVEE